MIYMNNTECLHENLSTTVGPYGPEDTCADCGHDVSADGPADDDWINDAYLAMAARPRPDTLVGMVGR